MERNTSDGVQLGLSANQNTFRTANVQTNGGHGILAAGASNTIRDNGRLNGNALNGILVMGDSNTLSNNCSEAGKGNGLHGIEVVPGADNNQLTSNQMHSNVLDGFHVFGAGNRLKSSSANANVGVELTIGPGNVNQGGNKAHTRTCTFGPGGGSCN